MILECLFLWVKNMKSSTSQNCQILQHLLEGNKITPLQALDKFRCFRLAARINNLRDQGYAINCDRVSVTASDGVKSIVAEYSMAEKS